MSLVVDLILISLNTVVRYNSFMEKDEKEQEPNDSDWGIPPSPDTAQNRDRAFRGQLILTIVSLVMIALPGILYWFFKK